MLDESLKTQLRAYLQRLTRPVVITASVNDTPRSAEMLELLREVAQLSEQVTLTDDGSAERRPSFALTSPGQDISLAFAGLPMGHEFTSLVLALLQVGGYPPKAEAQTLDQIRDLGGAFVFETYFSQSCQNCPDVVQALNLMAILNPGVRHVAIDGADFQDEVEARQVMSVPTIYLNGKLFGQGRMTLEEILSRLDSSAAHKEAAKIDAKQVFDILVVGGGPAGAAAAIYAARKGIRTGIVSERFGGQVLDTMAIENLISVPHTDGPRLAQALEAHVREYDVDIMNLQAARTLSRKRDFVEVALESGATVRSRAVILATGARWRQMDVLGEKEYRNKGVTYCPHCDGPLFKEKRVAVIGGGNSGVEAAIDLAGLASHVTVIEFESQLCADDVLQRKLKSLPNVDIILSAETTAVNGDGARVTGLTYKQRTTGRERVLPMDGIFVQIGLLPNTDWLKGAIELTSRGEVAVNAHAATSLEGVFAAGDCTTVPYKQIVIALGDGAKASLAAFDYLIRATAPARPEAEAA
ncbi:MAG: alkyl hydroperoxide reductase subunit F [Hyphomicrobium sp.]